MPIINIHKFYLNIKYFVNINYYAAFFLYVVGLLGFASTIKLAISSMLITLLVSLASIAGVTLNELWTLHQL